MYYLPAVHPGVVPLLVLEPFMGLGLRAGARGAVTSKFPRTLFYTELFTIYMARYGTWIQDKKTEPKKKN